MALPLYHPGHGYYMAERPRIGREGDFFTSPDVHAAFGATVMKQLAEMHRLLGAGNPITVVEGGAGKGSLAVQILDAARDRAPGFYNRLHYVIVEKSPAMAALQREGIARQGHGGRVAWAENMAEALTDCQGEGVVLTNELLDALPVHLVRYDGKEWREIYVDLSGEGFQERLAPLSTPRLATFLNALEGPFGEGYQTEVNLEALDWIRGVGEGIQKGFVITIDYGYPKGDYYAPQRRTGTLLCYHRHQTSEDPYRLVGEQDITAHVDFTALAGAGKEAGLEVTGYCEQFHFLMGLGIFDEFKGMEGVETGPSADQFRENLAIKRLLMPDAMGGTFKVLIQHKGIGRPRLGAFSFKDLSHRL